MTETFEAKTVVITGAAGGIGSAFCRRFADEGARVVAIDRDEAGLSRLAKGLSVQIVAVDLTDVEATMREVGGVGPVDVLINNAGITALGPARDIPFEAVEKVMSVNFHGSVNATRALVGSLVERQGRIAVMSSVSGFAPLLHRTAYSASKHALHGYFESLRTELVGDGVTVTMICPSFVGTGIENRAAARAADKTGEWATTGRQLAADQVAGQAIDGLRRRKRLVLPGLTSKAAYWTWKLSPASYERLMRSRID